MFFKTAKIKIYHFMDTFIGTKRESHEIYKYICMMNYLLCIHKLFGAILRGNKTHLDREITKFNSAIKWDGPEGSHVIEESLNPLKQTSPINTAPGVSSYCRRIRIRWPRGNAMEEVFLVVLSEFASLSSISKNYLLKITLTFS